MQRSNFFLVTMFFIATSIGPNLHAQSIDWINTTGVPGPWVHWTSNWSTGALPGVNDTAQFSHSDSYTVLWGSNSSSLIPEINSLVVSNGEVKFLNAASTQQEFLIGGYFGYKTPFWLEGPNTSLALQGIHLHRQGAGQISGGATLNIDGSHAAGTEFTIDASLYIGGNLNVHSGGVANLAQVAIENKTGTSGKLNVTGPGSLMDTGTLLVGSNDPGELRIDQAGVVTSSIATVAFNFDSGGSVVVVDGAGSRWEINESLTLGRTSDGTLRIENGGYVSAKNITVGKTNHANGSQIQVWNADSFLNVTGNLNVNASSSSPFDMMVNEGSVQVAGRTLIENNSAVQVENGGHFNFGRTDSDSYFRIYGGGSGTGSLAGIVEINGYNQINNLPDLSRPILLTDEVKYGNLGVIFGSGVSTRSLTNYSSGELRTHHGEWARFAGTGNSNEGEINNFGGTVEFENEFTNQVGGYISGRGQFIAGSGWTNDGVIAMSGGFSDFHGDLLNTANGQIAIGGGNITTFNDDVQMDPGQMNITVGTGSQAVFFGSYNGGNNGLGSVSVFGDLRPGNSPGVVEFGGDLTLGSFAITEIELGSTFQGGFDQLLVRGDFAVDGTLNVSLINGFELADNQRYVIAEVDGTLFGEFSNLAEGDLVGVFGGQDLFISYSAGDGNDIALFTAVPEPGSMGLILLGSLFVFCRTSRQS